MKKALLLLALGGGLLTPGRTVAGENRLWVAASVARFTWVESGPDGSRLLKESGPLYGLDFDALFGPGRLAFRLETGLQAGSVSYDGQVQEITGSTITLYPARSDTRYLRLGLCGEIGGRIGGDRLALVPLAGLGLRLWWREIEGTTYQDATGTQSVPSANETWTLFFAKLELMGIWRPAEHWRIVAEGGLLLPLRTRNETMAAAVEPRGQPSGFAQVGFDYRLLTVDLFYEGLRFDPSPPVLLSAGSTVLQIYQPRSSSDVFGLKVGLSLR